MNGCSNSDGLPNQKRNRKLRILYCKRNLSSPLGAGRKNRDLSCGRFVGGLSVADSSVADESIASVFW